MDESAADAHPPLLNAVRLYPAMLRDPFLSKHAKFYVRELRVAAYTQFLESYRRYAPASQRSGAAAHSAIISPRNAA